MTKGELWNINTGKPKTMNFVSTSKFQRNSPIDYEDKLKKKDTWWIVTSESRISYS